MTPNPRPARPARARSPRATPACARASLALAAPLSAEDCQVQSMADASPTKWHLAHVTWFFETFLLERFEAGFVPFDPAFRVLFNSYYQGVGEQYPRAQRGLVSRPGAGRREALSRERRRAHAGAARRVAATTPRSPRWSPSACSTSSSTRSCSSPTSSTRCRSTRSASAYARRWPMAQVRPQPLRWFGYEGGLVELGHDAGARRRLLLRQRDAAPPRLRRAVRARVAAGDATATSSPSSTTTATAGPSSGCRWAGTGSQTARAPRRSTGAATAAAG